MIKSQAQVALHSSLPLNEILVFIVCECSIEYCVLLSTTVCQGGQPADNDAPTSFDLTSRSS